MKKVWLAVVVLWTALLVTSCADGSVLILDDGMTDGSVQGDVQGGFMDDGQEIAKEESGAPLIMVHICGQIAEPGVYQVPEGSRVYEVIELAGGFVPGAAESYLNLAETVTDGQKLVVPSLDEVADDRYGELPVEDKNSGLININTADKTLLMSLPGIGEAKALAIIAWRMENGAFQTTEDIMQVSGIKGSAYEKIKQLITTE